jgi:very-short-patch-repair endonuclease
LWEKLSEGLMRGAFKMSKLKKFQKSLRVSQTNAEHFLWHQLRNRHFEGYKFRRQHIIQGYIVDFVCLDKKLIIELDGDQHSEQINYDNERTLKLEKDGFRVIRFWNNEVFLNMGSVLETIYQALNNTPHQSFGQLLPQGEKPSLSKSVVNSNEKPDFF